MTKNSTSPSRLAVIVPCYNEEDILPSSHQLLASLLHELVKKGKIHKDSFIAYINDGSKDTTWEVIENLRKSSFQVKGLKLLGNYGHQNALLAGLLTYAKQADYLLTLDADLQDDIKVVPEMIDKMQQGNEIIYGIRDTRPLDSWFKSLTARLFYKLMRRMGVQLYDQHADFRMISQKVALELLHFPEYHLFLRGIFPLMGFPSDTVYYERKPRVLGKSKYGLWDMVNFAFKGITSFSIQPLRLVTITGFIVFISSIGMGGYALYSYWFAGTVKGWTSTVLPMYFLGGIQLLSIGVIGEYLGKIYQEVKRRPRYLIEKEI